MCCPPLLVLIADAVDPDQLIAQHQVGTEELLRRQDIEDDERARAAFSAFSARRLATASSSGTGETEAGPHTYVDDVFDEDEDADDGVGGSGGLWAFGAATVLSDKDQIIQGMGADSKEAKRQRSKAHARSSAAVVAEGSGGSGQVCFQGVMIEEVVGGEEDDDYGDVDDGDGGVSGSRNADPPQPSSSSSSSSATASLFVPPQLAKAPSVPTGPKFIVKKRKDTTGAGDAKSGNGKKTKQPSSAKPAAVAAATTSLSSLLGYDDDDD
jgi:hypothetical protein